MFFTMFAASALATVLFSPKANEAKDYTNEFRTVNNKLDNIEGKIDQIIDTQAFMKARSCLENFSPLLLDGVKLSYKYHTLQDIMESAQEGFDLLCKTACADEHNFLNARKIFAETWGNEEWVNKKFGKEIDEWTERISLYNQELKNIKNIVKESNEKIKILFDKLMKDIPLKKTIFGMKIDEAETKKLIIELFETIFNDAIIPSNALAEFMTENQIKKPSIYINVSNDEEEIDIINDFLKYLNYSDMNKISIEYQFAEKINRLSHHFYERQFVVSNSDSPELMKSVYNNVYGSFDITEKSDIVESSFALVKSQYKWLKKQKVN